MRRALLYIALGLIFTTPLRAEMIGNTEDPAKIGVGARVMGMGRAFEGLADDGSAIFINPAGLAGLRSWYVLSMYANLLEDVPYQTLSFSYPFKLQGLPCGWGAGFIGSGVYNIPSPSQSGFTYFDYRNNLYVASLAAQISESLSLGMNFKIFDEGYSGTVVSSGTGKDLDLGIKYNYADWLALGLTAQNFLPASLGAVVKWETTGAEESIPCLIKSGMIMGFYNQSLTLLLDNDIWALRKLPPQYHLGLEWRAFPILLLRGGLDQTLSSAHGGVYSNPTFGVGLEVWNLRFDYAYHAYYEQESNVTHFISVSYSPAMQFEEKLRIPAVASQEAQPWIYVRFPQDGATTYSRRVKLSAKVFDPQVALIRIRQAPVWLDEDRGVEAVIDLHYGPNYISLEGVSASGVVEDQTTIRILLLKTFSDIYPDFWAKQSIEYLSTLNIFRGYPQDAFKPDKTMTRAELVAVLMRASGEKLPKVKRAVFKDVTKKAWYAPAVKRALDLGIVTGYRNKFYPNNAVTRAEAIFMLARLEKLPLPAGVQERHYRDVPIEHWAARAVVAARQAGWLNYIAGFSLSPNQKITRAEVAELLMRTARGQALTVPLKLGE